MPNLSTSCPHYYGSFQINADLRLEAWHEAFSLGRGSLDNGWVHEQISSHTHTTLSTHSILDARMVQHSPLRHQVSDLFHYLSAPWLELRSPLYSGIWIPSYPRSSQICQSLQESVGVLCCLLLCYVIPLTFSTTMLTTIRLRSQYPETAPSLPNARLASPPASRPHTPHQILAFNTMEVLKALASRRHLR